MSLISIKTNNILYMQAVYLIFHSASVKLLERLCKVKWVLQGTKFQAIVKLHLHEISV